MILECKVNVEGDMFEILIPEHGEGYEDFRELLRKMNRDGCRFSRYIKGFQIRHKMSDEDWQSMMWCDVDELKTTVVQLEKRITNLIESLEEPDVPSEVMPQAGS
jgi:hypothetical protein